MEPTQSAAPDPPRGHVRRPAADAVFPGQSEMGTRCRALDWATTPLGPVERWPQSLRTAAALVLGSAFPSILVWGADLVQLYNDAYAPLIGRKHPAALGAPTHACWPEIRLVQEPIFARVFRGETVQLADAPYQLDREGTGALEEAYFTATFVPVPLESGRVGGSLSTLFETTAHVQARARAADHARLLDSMSDAFAAFDDEWRYTYVNRAAEALHGRPREAVLGRTVWECFPELRTNNTWEHALTAQREQRLVEYVTYIESVGKWVRARNYPLPGGGMAAVVRDVTDEHARAAERERLLAEAEVARARVTTVLESISDAFYAVDGAFRFTYVTRKTEELWGRRREELIGRNFWTEFPATVDSESYRMHVVAMAERRVLHFETVSPILGRWTEVSLYPDSGGGLSCYFRDISERKAAEAERERLLAEAQAANRAKGEFLAVMSHELRTPLNAIGGYAELIEMGLRGPVTEQQRDDLARIQRSQRHLLGLVNEVLNYAKLETGSVRYDATDVLVCDALAAAEGLVAPQAHARGLTLAASDCAPDLAVRADPEKLQQILVNLLSNAVKFTDPGGRVEAACTADGNSVRLTIRDTGIGIAADKLEAIFEPFVQVRADLTRPHEGTGLGLAISRDLARGMEGDLTAESTPGAGSTFTVTLPRA
jgi:PAS domain S-box-containing protein